jgi:exonuclease III
LNNNDRYYTKEDWNNLDPKFKNVNNRNSFIKKMEKILENNKSLKNNKIVFGEYNCYHDTDKFDTEQNLNKALNKLKEFYLKPANKMKSIFLNRNDGWGGKTLLECSLLLDEATLKPNGLSLFPFIH